MKRQPRTKVCFECETVYETTELRCPNCAAYNDRPTGKAAAVELCEYELDGARCPMYASIDKRWCRFHQAPENREHTDGNRSFLERMLAMPRECASTAFAAQRENLINQRMDASWKRQDGESRDDYHDRMIKLRNKLMPRVGTGLGLPPDEPIDRKAVQEQAETARRRRMFADVEMVKLMDAFDDELDRLSEQGLEPEAAAGVAFERVLKEAML